MTSLALHGDEDGRRGDEDGRRGNEVSDPSKIAPIFLTCFRTAPCLDSNIRFCES